MLDITVVIPAKNRAHTLVACLDSVLAQTLPPREVIVVDDGSTDHTPALVAGYAARGVVYTRLAEGAGAQAARNQGARQAACDWIAFQDSDDLWLPHKLALQAEALRDVGFDRATVVHGDGLKRLDATGETTPLAVPDTSGHCHAALLQRPGPLFPTLLTSKEALERCAYLDPDCPSYQEWDTALRLSQHCRFIHLHEPLFIWVWHRQETVSKDSRRAVRGYTHILRTWRDEIVAVHGLQGWRRQTLEAVALAMRAGLWAEALALIEGEPPHRSYALARRLCLLKLAPRGVGRLLRLAA